MPGVPLVIGLGDPVVDECIDCDEAFLAALKAQPGGCTCVDAAEMAALQAAATRLAPPTRVPGGSAANVLKGLARVSGGDLSCKLLGMVGADDAGALYTQQLRCQGVEPMLLTSTSGAPTARCLCLVTPDGQRTMRTCLGAAAELTSTAQLEGVWRPPALLHCEGYVLFKPELARGAMQAAKRAGALVSLDLASFETVAACRPALLALLAEGLVDVVFANEEEAATLAAGGAAPADDAEAGRAAAVEAAQALILRHARVCVVSLGSRGAVARSADGEVGRAAASKVSVVDTIGAGDLFSAGFLYAFLSGAGLATCCAAGCAAGAEAVQARGSALSEDAWRGLRERILGLLAAAPARPLAVAAGKRGGRGASMSVASSLGSMASCASQTWLAGSPLDAWRQ